MFISDSAITNENDDGLNRAGFSKKLGEQILKLGNNSESKVIAIYGDWGKGKTSLLNIAVSHIEQISKRWKKSKRPIIFRFNPWNFSEQESLLLAFLQQLFSAVNEKLPTTKKDFQKKINSLAKTLGAFEGVPIAGSSLAATSKVISLIVPDETLEELREKIDKYFGSLECKVIIIIDDIDRLTEKEIRQIFQLIKINADFPNTIYLTAFDRKVVEKALTTDQGVSGRDYLEKIIQVGFDMPATERSRVQDYLFSELNKILEIVDTTYWDAIRWGNLYFSGVHKFFDSLRDVKRFINSLRFNISLVTGEINPIDFIGIEAIRVFYPEIYNSIVSNKDLFVNTRFDTSNQKRINENRDELEKVFSQAGDDKKLILNTCMELFPQLRIYYPQVFSSYNRDVIAWRRERRICSDDVFDFYFVMGTPKDEVAKSELQQFVAVADQSDELITLLRKYKTDGRIGRLLDLLGDILDNLTDNNIFSFVQALLEFGDELPNINKGIVSASTDIQIASLIFRGLEKIKDNQLRYRWFLTQIKTSQSLYTVVEQVSWNLSDDGKPSERALFDEKQLVSLTKACVAKIAKSAISGKLLTTKNINYILYRWKEWSPDEKNIIKFMNTVIRTPDTALDLLAGLLWEGESHAFGNYVSKKERQLDLKTLREFADLEKLKKTLSKLVETDIEKLPESQQLAIQLFLKDEK